MTVLGAGLLWFGWFGFNAGSALGANGLAANAFVTTNTAAAMAALTWVTITWLHTGTPSVLGAAIGAVAGPGGDHPGRRLRDAGRVDPDRPRRRRRLLRRGPAARSAPGRRRARRLRRPRRRRRLRRPRHRRLRHHRRQCRPASTGCYGNPGQLVTQLIAVAVVGAYSAVATAAILFVVNLVVADPRRGRSRGDRTRPRPARRNRLPALIREGESPMVIAALVTFAILLVAWIFAPSEARHPSASADTDGGGAARSPR